ncbi:DUF1638 domain-containing protein [Amorphus suaedae]
MDLVEDGLDEVEARDRVAEPRTVTVIACGALAREILAVKAANRLDHLRLACVPATLHNHPDRIPEAVRGAIRAARAAGADEVAVAFGDCGTGGQLDRVLAEEGVERIDGPHCYAMFMAGFEGPEPAEDEDMTAFFLTDFLVRQFETLVIRPLGIDRHPELRDMYFGHYRSVVYLAQTDDPVLDARARAAAGRLGLAYVRRATGMGALTPFLRAL